MHYAEWTLAGCSFAPTGMGLIPPGLSDPLGILE